MWKNKVFFSIVLFLLILNNSCVSSSPWHEGDHVIKLTNQNFVSKTRQYDVLLVMFYVKWCSHCRRLHPDYEQAGTKLAHNAEFPIHIAKIDCTDDRQARCEERYDIEGYPTLRIYRHGQFSGEVLNYGNRTTEEIVKTMKALKKTPTYTTDQTDGVKDERNKATSIIQYTWLLVGLLMMLYKSI